MSDYNKITIRYGDGALEWDVSQYGRKFRERNSFVNMREDRAASGKLRRDLQVIKKSFVLSFDRIDHEEVERLEHVIETSADKVLELDIYDGYDTIPKTYSVLISDFEKERDVGHLWSGVSIELQEV